MDDQNAEGSEQQRPPQQSHDPRSNQHNPSTPTTGLCQRENDTSRSTGRSGRQNAATRRNVRREEWLTAQGPVKKQQTDGMAHRGAVIRKRGNVRRPHGRACSDDQRQFAEGRPGYRPGIPKETRRTNPAAPATAPEDRTVGTMHTQTKHRAPAPRPIEQRLPDPVMKPTKDGMSHRRGGDGRPRRPCFSQVCSTTHDHGLRLSAGHVKTELCVLADGDMIPNKKVPLVFALERPSL